MRSRPHPQGDSCDRRSRSSPQSARNAPWQRGRPHERKRDHGAHPHRRAPRQLEEIIAVFAGLAGRLRNPRGVIVDSNILLDVATSDPTWSVWPGVSGQECLARSVWPGVSGLGTHPRNVQNIKRRYRRCLPSRFVRSIAAGAASRSTPSAASLSRSQQRLDRGSDRRAQAGAWIPTRTG
jgi:hypothetical protein